MTSLWRHLWTNYDTLDFKILTQCVKMLGERVLQVWRWYLHRFRIYRKKTRGAAWNSPPSGARVNGRNPENIVFFRSQEGGGPLAPLGCAPAVNCGFGGGVMTVTYAKSSADSENLTLKIRSERGKFVHHWVSFPTQIELGTLLCNTCIVNVSWTWHYSILSSRHELAPKTAMLFQNVECASWVWPDII